MSITQTRMIRLISAGQDYQRALQALADSLGALATDFRKGALSAEEVINQLEYIAKFPAANLTSPGESSAVLWVEAEHFRRNGRDNLRRAEALRAKRGGGGWTSAPDAPFPRAPTARTGFNINALSRPVPLPETAQIERLRAEIEGVTLSPESLREIEEYSAMLRRQEAAAEVGAGTGSISHTVDAMMKQQRKDFGLDGPEAEAILQASFDDPNAPSLPVDFDED